MFIAKYIKVSNAFLNATSNLILTQIRKVAQEYNWKNKETLYT